MKSKSTDELIIKYMDGQLDEKGQNKLIEALNKEGHSISSLSELNDLIEKLGDIPVAIPSAQMTDQFQEHLDKLTGRQDIDISYLKRIIVWIKDFKFRKLAAQIAFAVVLIFAGWMFGQNSEQEIQSLKSEVSEMRSLFSLSMLNNPSPSQRIQALSHLAKSDQMNFNIRSSIIRILNRDPNVNVRLIALETLMRYSEDKNVRSELILSIDKQNEPVMQMAMTEAMLILRDKNSIYPLKKMLARKDLNYMVRTLIEESLLILS